MHYAHLEAERRGQPAPLLDRVSALRSREPGDTRPLTRALFKDVVFPSTPAKPVALFLYMYVARLGLLDGAAGLRLCFYHAWCEATVAALRAESTAAGREAIR